MKSLLIACFSYLVLIVGMSFAGKLEREMYKTQPIPNRELAVEKGTTYFISCPIDHGVVIEGSRPEMVVKKWINNKQPKSSNLSTITETITSYKSCTQERKLRKSIDSVLNYVPLLLNDSNFLAMDTLNVIDICGIKNIYYSVFCGLEYYYIYGCNSLYKDSSMTKKTSTPKQEPKIYPNPSRDVVHLDIPEIENNHYSYYLIDVQGKIIHQSDVKSSMTDIYKGDLPSGNYFLKLINESHPDKNKDFKVIFVN
jgi:hypothetical protein